MNKVRHATAASCRRLCCCCCCCHLLLWLGDIHEAREYACAVCVYVKGAAVFLCFEDGVDALTPCADALREL
jgi:hypothetical protein